MTRKVVLSAAAIYMAGGPAIILHRWDARLVREEFQ